MSSEVLKIKTEIEAVDTGLAEDERKRLCGSLSSLLADTILLQIKSQVYHWNIVGPLFKPIHELTEEHYKDLFAAADVIAERIRALGYPAPQSIAELVPRSKVDEESSIRSAREMVEQLVEDHEAIVRNLRQSAKHAEQLDDYVTNDLMVGRLGFHEKAIWMLRAIIAD